MGGPAAVDHRCFIDAMAWFLEERGKLTGELHRRIDGCGCPEPLQVALGRLCRRSGDSLVEDILIVYKAYGASERD